MESSVVFIIILQTVVHLAKKKGKKNEPTLRRFDLEAIVPHSEKKVDSKVGLKNHLKKFNVEWVSRQC